MVDPRWRAALAVTPYLVVTMLAAFSLGVEWGDPARLVPELLLCGLYLAWVLVLRDLPLPWRGTPAAIVLLLTGLVVLNLLLVLHDGWFGFLAVATFSMAYSLVPWPWELLAVAATAVVAGLAQASSFGADAPGTVGRAMVIALNIVVMCGLSWGLRLAQQQLELAATEAERARLAREIHDTLAQGFAGIVTQLQAAEHAPDETARVRHTGAALALARDGLTEARRSMQALRPAALDRAGVAEAIGETARRWSERTGIPVEVRAIDPLGVVSTDAEVALLRTAQEALANVERHAGAHRVALRLQHGSRGVQLEVSDDGRGFVPEATRNDADGGYGLIAMRERIEALAGHLVIESSPGRGTVIRAAVPA